MIVGIGIDLIEVERVSRALDEHPRFSDRVFTAEEVRYSSGKRNSAQHLAARFAAKEAFFKALGRRIPWADVGVVNLESGQPLLEVKNAETMGYTRAHLSISHLKSHAQAVVVLEK